MDTDGAVRESAIANVLARVITDTAVNRRQRVVSHKFTPSAFEVTFLRQRKPGLNVLARRTGVIARRQEIDVLGPAGAQGTSALRVPRKVRALCEIGVSNGVAPL